MKAKSNLLGEMGLDEVGRGQMLQSLGIDRTTIASLKELKAELSDYIPDLVARWFDRQAENPITADLVAYAKERGHLGPGMTAHLLTMLEGNYDEAFFQDRLRVGLIHEHVGVAPSWYMGAWRNMADLVRENLESRGIVRKRTLDLLGAMERAVQLDQVLALEAYFHVKARAVAVANAELSMLADELEKKNSRLAAQYTKVREASRIKEEFLSRVSHELRTPLNSIIGYSDILLDGIDGPLNEEQEKSLKTLRRSGELLLSLIEGMISASRLAAAGVISALPFSMTRSVAGALEKYRKSALAKGLTFTFEDAPEEMSNVRGDEDAFLSALGQVLDNAIKFTESGGIKVHFFKASDGVRTCVSDTGPGVPPEERARIFQAFHQVDGGDDRMHSGLGMGLTLAFRAMKAMGGSLDLYSDAAGGSTFCLWLPAETGENPQTEGSFEE